MRYFAVGLTLILGVVLPAFLVCGWEAYHAEISFIKSLPDYFAGPTEFAILILTQIESLTVLAVAAILTLKFSSAKVQVVSLCVILFTHVLFAAILIYIRLQGGWEKLFFIVPWHNFF